MALTTCPDCNREVSPNARSCTHCGKPNSIGSIFTRNLGFDGVVFLIMIVGGILLAAMKVTSELGGILISAFGLLLLQLQSLK
jgi:hypothetical protein